MATSFLMALIAQKSANTFNEDKLGMQHTSDPPVINERGGS
jgi:hypothetical protein